MAAALKASCGPPAGQTLATGTRHTPRGALAPPFCTTRPAGEARPGRTRAGRWKSTRSFDLSRTDTSHSMAQTTETTCGNSRWTSTDDKSTTDFGRDVNATRARTARQYALVASPRHRFLSALTHTLRPVPARQLHCCTSATDTTPRAYFYTQDG